MQSNFSLPYESTIMYSTISFFGGLVCPFQFSCPFTCHALDSSLSLISYIWPVPGSCCLNASILSLSFLFHVTNGALVQALPHLSPGLGSLKSIGAHAFPFTHSRLKSLKYSAGLYWSPLISHSLVSHKLKSMPSVHYMEYSTLDGQALEGVFSIICHSQPPTPYSRCSKWPSNHYCSLRSHTVYFLALLSLPMPFCHSWKTFSPFISSPG